MKEHESILYSRLNKKLTQKFLGILTLINLPDGVICCSANFHERKF